MIPNGYWMIDQSCRKNGKKKVKDFPKFNLEEKKS